MLREIAACRACGNRHLRPLLTLGEMHLPGSLLSGSAAQAPLVPVELAGCDEAAQPDACGLVQLRHALDLPELRAPGYGARSARHPASARHLAGIVGRLRRHVTLTHHDVVLDIGSHDGTLLSCFEPGGPILLGMDPAIAHYRRGYRPDMELLPQPFSAEVVRRHLGSKRVKIATAIAVLDGLDDPLTFLKDLARVLDDDGIACVEQVYLPALVKHNAHDSFRPEHRAYYSVRQLLWLAEKAGLKVLDVLVNDAQGGSVAVTFARARSPRGRPPSSLGWYLENEAARRLAEPATWSTFRERMEEQKHRLLALLDGIRSAGERVVGWGTSAAGNTLLERYGIGPDRLSAVASDDPADAGLKTPGTGIPVITEAAARAQAPDYLLALARDFREDVLRGLNEYLLGGGKVILPLPEVEIVTV